MLKRAFDLVFSERRSWMIAGWSIALFLLALVYIGNIRTVASVVGSGIPFSSKFSILFLLPENLLFQNTGFSLAQTLVMAILFGANIAFFAFYFRRTHLSRHAGGVLSRVRVPYAGIGGAVAAALSVGCASCGTFILGYVLSLVGAGTVLAVLPFGGAEIGLVGVVGLGYSLYRLAQEIDKPLVC